MLGLERPIVPLYKESSKRDGIWSTSIKLRGWSPRGQDGYLPSATCSGEQGSIQGKPKPRFPAPRSTVAQCGVNTLDKILHSFFKTDLFVSVYLHQKCPKYKNCFSHFHRVKSFTKSPLMSSKRTCQKSYTNFL